MEKDLDNFEGSDNSIKSHEEIIAMIQEIKELEERFGSFDVVEIEEESEDLIEVEHGELPKRKKISSPPALKKPEQKTKPIVHKKLDKKQIFKVKVRSKPQVHKKRAVKSATFKIRLDDKGNLVNLDFNKPKPETKTKRSGLKKKTLQKDSKQKDNVETDETIGSRLKSKIGNLKRAIPGRKSNNEKSEKDD